MYSYQIGYHSEEESGYIELCHYRKFEDNEIEELVTAASLEVIREQLKNKKRYHILINISFSDIYREVADYMCIHNEFEKVIYTSKCSIYGWGSLREPDYFHHGGESTRRLREQICAEFPVTQEERTNREEVWSMEDPPDAED